MTALNTARLRHALNMPTPPPAPDDVMRAVNRAHTRHWRDDGMAMRHSDDAVLWWAAEQWAKEHGSEVSEP